MNNLCSKGHDKAVTGTYPGGRCAECRREASSARYHSNRDRFRKKRREEARERNTGWSHEAFTVALEEQGNACAICKVSFDTVDRIHADHKHGTWPKQTRALLCPGCNVGLGYFKDDPERMRAAADYVEKHSKNKPRR